MNSENSSEPAPKTPQGITDSALEGVRFGKGKVFTRRNMVQVQESNPKPPNEVIMFNSSLQDETEFHLNSKD